MTDFLEVKAIRTFAIGKELKTKKNKPFPVEAGEAKQLAAQGLVDIVGEVTTDEVADEASTDEKPVISSARSAKKKERPDAINEGS